MARRSTRLDIAYNVTRHINRVSCSTLQSTLDQMLADGDTIHSPERSTEFYDIATDDESEFKPIHNDFKPPTDKRAELANIVKKMTSYSTPSMAYAA